ncbi:helix-turn-helix domain-containing protein [Streptomyces massasporeus]|uniref:helix-turn-helix domain-containing protein n=1 Tax=Streptomyces massasporeus TaxID=67324 RepID=UPI0036AAF6B1
MINLQNLREQVLTAAEKYDLPLSVRQADILSNHLVLHANRGNGRPARLTNAQCIALVGLASGESAKETGRRIGRSEDTIKTHRLALYRALGARSGPHAVTIAIASGLLNASQLKAASGGAR